MMKVTKTKSVLKVTNQDGRSFNLLVIEAGDHYGMDDCLTHQRPENPLVEFYDATYQGKYDNWQFGQFVSRYYISTLLGDYKDLSIGGLCLDGGTPEWNVDSVAIKVVLDWLKAKTGFWQHVVKSDGAGSVTTIAGEV